MIIPLTTSGESMAMGIRRVFPTASHQPASNVQDNTVAHMDANQTVILVDSVITARGKDIINFVQYIRNLNEHIQIIGCWTCTIFSHYGR
jgi:uracil phosphoribosyltransferase